MSDGGNGLGDSKGSPFLIDLIYKFSTLDLLASILTILMRNF
jgi:hypothetical protein